MRGSDGIWPFASRMNKCAGADMPSVAGTSKIILGHFSRFGLPAAISPDCPWSCCLPACPVDVYFLRHHGGQAVQAHDRPDVRDVKARASLRPYVLLQTHGCDAATCHFCNYLIHDVLQNSSGPPASGKIPEAFQASFVVTAQPVTDPRGTVYQDAPRTCQAHAPCGRRLFWSVPFDPSPFCTPFRVPPVLCCSCLREMRSDLQTFRLVMVSAQKLFRVSICAG